MTTFRERAKPNTTIQVMQAFVPRIQIHPDALTKMQVYVENVEKEVGWLGTAYQTGGNTILIRDVFLFDQEVHATTTEITPEGLADFAQELLLQPDGVDIWNNMKMWGHSHVQMAVNPSGQDDKQMETFSEGGHDWFIRLIANKQGDMKLDLYDYQHGTIFVDLSWTEYADAETEQIMAQISELYQQINSRKSVFKAAIEEPIKQEIQTKVRAKTYGYDEYGRQAGTYWSRQQTGSQWAFPIQMEGGTQNNSKSNTEIGGGKHEKKNARIGTGSYQAALNLSPETDDLITDFDDLGSHFHIQDVMLFGRCPTIADLYDELIDLGYENYFSDNDVEKIWQYSKMYCAKYDLI